MRRFRETLPIIPLVHARYFLRLYVVTEMIGLVFVKILPWREHGQAGNNIASIHASSRRISSLNFAPCRPVGAGPHPWCKPRELERGLPWFWPGTADRLRGADQVWLDSPSEKVRNKSAYLFRRLGSKEIDSGRRGCAAVNEATDDDLRLLSRSKLGP
jgi:hypothetical protein